MIRCQSCGQTNTNGSNFCRFCGVKFNQIPQNPKGNYNQSPPKPFSQNQQQTYDQSPPRPYSWKTDEFPIKEQQKKQTKEINRVRPLANQTQRINPQMNAPMNQPTHQPNQQMQMQPQYQNTLSAGYHCPYCNSNALPQVVKKVSAAGWAVFTALLITTFIFFWVGLLIQEERRICPVCKARVG